MKKAYIIMAHRSPDLLYRLVERLCDTNAHFFIHLDSRTPRGPFDSILSLDRKITFVEREASYWGEISYVQATLNAMKAVQRSGISFDRIFLLSGQDYPIKSNREIDEILARSPHTIFLEYFALPAFQKWQPSGGMYRVNKYFFGMPWRNRMLAKALNGLGIIFPFLRRKPYQGMKPYSGSTWWIMDMRALEYVLHFVARNPGYVRYHRHTFACDEVFFHMILVNATDPVIQRNLVNNNLRYIRWENIKSSHPEILTEADLDVLKQSGALFARKFDPAVDTAILDSIDRHCLGGAVKPEVKRAEVSSRPEASKSEARASLMK